MRISDWSSDVCSSDLAAQDEAAGTEAHEDVAQGVATHADATGDRLRGAADVLVRRLEQLDGARRQSGAAEIPAVHIALQVAAVDHVHLAVCVQVGHAQRHQAIGITYGAGTRYQLGGPGDRATRA